MVKVRSILIAAAMTLVGCNTFDIVGFVAPTGDVVNSRFEQSMSLSGDKATAHIEAEEAYLVYVCTDPHIGKTSTNLQKFASLMRNDHSAPLGIVLGDCTELQGAMTTYAEAIKSDSEAPIFSLIGNHDLYFSGWEDFRSLLGPSVYWFEVAHSSGSDLFIALDSASGTLGRKQMEWLKGFLTGQRHMYRHCVILTHTNLFYTDNSQTGSGNMAMEETHALLDLFSRNNVTLCLQGHDHYREDLTFDGVRYTIVGTIRDEADKPEYLIIRLSDNGTEYIWKEL